VAHQMGSYHTQPGFTNSLETPLNHANMGRAWNPGTARDPFFDLNLKGENLFHPPGQTSWAAAVAPDKRDRRERGVQDGQHPVCGIAVLDGGCGDDTASNRPLTSTAMCRLRPFVRSVPSHP